MHTATRIFVDRNFDPPKGISLGDMRAVFCVSGRSAGAIMEKAKVNRWAGHKPVRSDKLGILTLADFQDAYFGLDVPIYGPNHISVLSTFLESFATAYGYLPPRGYHGGAGNANEWYWRQDLNGYDHEAEPFVYEAGCSLPHTFAYGSSGSQGINFTLALNTGLSLHGGIPIEDWKVGGHNGASFDTYHFGLIFVHGNDAPMLVTAENPIENGDLTVHIDETNSGLDGLETSYTYTVYPVLSRVVHTTLSSIGNTSNETLVALPMTTFQFSQYPVSSTVTYDMIAADAWQGAYARLYIEATIGIASTGGYHSVSTNKLQLYRASSDTDTEGTLIGEAGNYYDLGTIATDAPVTFNPGAINLEQFPEYVRLHLYNDSVSGMTLDYWVLVRQDE